MARPEGRPLDQGTLHEVVEVEQRIKAMLEAETADANAWRDRRRREIDEARRAEIEALERERARRRAAAEDQAAAEAAGILRQARDEAARIEQLGEAQLRDIVWRHLGNIVPGGEA